MIKKLVKSVTRSVTNVVKGATKAVSSVVKGVGSAFKSIANSKIGKILLAAATIYFGGAAIMGAMGGAAAGTGFWGTIGGAIQGAGAGISNAWAGLTGAVTGGGLGSLQQGFTGAYSAGQGAVGGVQAVGMNLPAGAQPSGAVTSPVGSSSVASQPLTSAVQGGGVVPGATPPAASGGFFSDPLVKYAAVTGGTQLAAGAIQGYGQQKAMEEQRAYEDQREREERERQDQNMRTEFQFAGAEGEGDRFAGSGNFMPMPGREAPNMAFVGQGLIGGGMYNPTFGSQQMPVYNPAYAGMPIRRV